MQYFHKPTLFSGRRGAGVKFRIKMPSGFFGDYCRSPIIYNKVNGGVENHLQELMRENLIYWQGNGNVINI